MRTIILILSSIVACLMVIVATTYSIPENTCKIETDEVELEIDTIEDDQLSMCEDDTKPVERSNYKSDYDYYIDLIMEAAELRNLDGVLAAAIWRLETGNGTSQAFIVGHNFGGLTGKSGLMTFETEEAGLEAYMNCLSWYSSKGMFTPEEMAQVYCPDNGEWCKLVQQIMKELQ